MNKNHFAVIMAGGVGSRFWPVSTTDFPKQFHDMLGTGESLIQRTFARLEQLVPANQIYILTNLRYRDIVSQQLPKITAKQIIAEPAMRNTAPCILYAALKIQKENPNALMLVAPSDHWIEDEAAFGRDIQYCFEKCTQQARLMTLGIPPTFPNTGYGYIQAEKTDSRVKKVIRFTEKPDYKTAKSFLKTGDYSWNSGIFVWSISSILEDFLRLQNEMYQLFSQGIPDLNTDRENDFIAKTYPLATDISIDYAILEQSDRVEMLPASFDWNDLGTWGSLYDKLDKNSTENAIVNTRVISENATGNMIRSETNKILVLDSLDNFIIVDKAEVLLIYPKEKEQNIKKILQKVKRTYGTEYS